VSNSWWDHLRRPDTPLQTQPGAGALPRKAVRWQSNYPATAPRPDPLYPDESDPEMTEYYRVRQQGFVSTPPPNQRDSAVGQCPGCHGSNFFRRRWANKECAPLCTDCGYNGDYFTQSGNLLNAVGMKSSGPMQFARTDNPTGESQFRTDPAVTRDFSWSSVR
jgi:hypothetical protein